MAITPDTSGMWYAVDMGRNAWATLMTLVLAVSSFWIPSSNAIVLERPLKPVANGTDLKILAIGDSITYGAGSPFCPVHSPSINCNGYRKPLYESLVARGNKVEFVGGTRAGDFPENLCEGHRGGRIDYIRKHSLNGIYAAPNIVLLHVGTNDVKDNQPDFPHAQEQLQELISLIYKQSPNAVVFLCTLIPANANNYPGTAKRMPAFNEKIPHLVAYFKERSKKIVLVDMNSKINVVDLSDGLHPTISGYQKMATAFLNVIESSPYDISKPDKGSDPPMATTPDPVDCKATPPWYKIGQTADGTQVYIPSPQIISFTPGIIPMLLLRFKVYSGGDFVQKWGVKIVVTGGHCPSVQAYLMDLDGDGMKDYTCVDLDTGRARVWRKNGTKSEMNSGWGEEEEVATGSDDRSSATVIFVDLNDNGRDSSIYVDPFDGSGQMRINQGKQDGTYLWEGLGTISLEAHDSSDIYKLLLWSKCVI